MPSMLLTRAEMSLDFGGERLQPERDRAILQWIFDQFLYGEVTGIQVGHWLYEAPDLAAAPAGRIVPFAMRALDISATALRGYLAAGESPRYLAPDAVLDYISRHRLYRPAAA